MSTEQQAVHRRRAEAYAADLLGAQQERVAASQDLVALLVARLGDDLGRAIALMDKARTDATLTKALKEARKQMRPARKAQTKAALADEDRETAIISAHATSVSMSAHLSGKARISGLSDEDARRQLREAQATTARLRPDATV